MSISVVLEPKAGGYRASMTSPFDLCVEGATEDLALQNMRRAYDARLEKGARVVQFPITNVERILETSRAVGAHPLFEEFQKILEENRRVSNTIPDHDES